jgi:hypothetical protein
MKTSIVALVSALAASTAALPQGADASAKALPFRLVLAAPKDANASTKYNGKYLAACHQGAAIKGLCVSNSTDAKSGTVFYLKANDVKSQSGELALDQTVNGNQTVPTLFSMTYYATSNVAVPVFSPAASSNFPVVFDQDGTLGYKMYKDDTTVPPTETDWIVKNWYICATQYNYNYETLAWVNAKYPFPQNPSCEKVEVKRVVAK